MGTCESKVWFTLSVTVPERTSADASHLLHEVFFGDQGEYDAKAGQWREGMSPEN